MLTAKTKDWSLKASHETKPPRMFDTLRKEEFAFEKIYANKTSKYLGYKF